jgi:polysaccharide biosynthesis/export protein
MPKTRNVRLLGAVLLLAAATGCSTLPQSGPDMSNISEEADDLNIEFVTLTPATVPPFGPVPTPDNPMAAQINPGASRLKLGPGDVLRIQMFETSNTGSLFAEEGSGVLNRVIVDDRGNIALPYAGTMRAAGLTPADLQQKIAQQLASIAVQPAAYVEVVEDHSNSVMVAGAVPEPGRTSLQTGAASALDAINMAGGVEGDPWHYDVLLRRDGTVRRVPLSDLLNGQDFSIKPGDRLQVQQRPKRFIAMGALQEAGAYDFPSSNLNLLEALAAAGGLSDQRANRNGVYVYRPSHDAAQKPKLFLLDMADPESVLVAEAFAVQPGDAVYVTNAVLTDLNKFLEPILRSIAIFNFATVVSQ